MSSPSLAHEFKNQIGIILGFIELLIAETHESDSRRVDLLEVQKAAQRLLAMLPDIVTTRLP